ncbi:hypothetical protein SCOCK_30023 [Actinacidiphila cocklensis]|uniref:Uncharacterized protein n=1 Tax=Actinacidiphila cocklensis TaxID=887465 RepID=A0A9W4GSI8_9ACTN|nr:hypothetical protein SCOCK_30023 [Actinacidiphila cocklensis]
MELHARRAGPGQGAAVAAGPDGGVGGGQGRRRRRRAAGERAGHELRTARLPSDGPAHRGRRGTRPGPAAAGRGRGRLRRTAGASRAERTRGGRRPRPGPGRGARGGLGHLPPAARRQGRLVHPRPVSPASAGGDTLGLALGAPASYIPRHARDSAPPPRSHPTPARLRAGEPGLLHKMGS